MISKKRLILLTVVIFFGYLFLFTGPRNLNEYPDRDKSEYYLPWKAGVARLISQGNRSFLAHRMFLEYSWDVWMPIGTQVLAARDGVVVEVVSNLDGIGIFRGNRIVIQHADGTKAFYGHLKHEGALVEINEKIQQGQVIGFSGMVGFAINPHLHFHVISRDGKTTIPVSFRDVEGGVPFAGYFYTSGNLELKK